MADTSQMVFDVDVDQVKPGPFKRALAKIRELTDAYQAVGGMFTGPQAAEMLEVTKQRAYQLRDQGILEEVEMEGKKFITGRSILARMEAERQKGGAGNKAPEMTPQKRVALLRKGFSSE